MPELDDDFAQSVSDFDTLDEYKDDIKAKLAEDKKNAAAYGKEEALAAILAERVEADVPDVMIEAEANHMVEGFARNLSGRGIRMEHYLQYMGGSVEDLRDSYREPAQRNVRARLALEAIANAEGFTAGSEEIDEEIKTMAERYNMEADRLKGAMSPRELRSLGIDIRVQKAMKLVLETAVEK
jgi:trigger factor